MASPVAATPMRTARTRNVVKSAAAVSTVSMISSIGQALLGCEQDATHAGEALGDLLPVGTGVGRPEEASIGGAEGSALPAGGHEERVDVAFEPLRQARPAALEA